MISWMIIRGSLSRKIQKRPIGNETGENGWVVPHHANLQFGNARFIIRDSESHYTSYILNENNAANYTLLLP